MNHVLKSNINWTSQKIPDLIKMIYGEVQFQKSLNQGAFYGQRPSDH